MNKVMFLAALTLCLITAGYLLLFSGEEVKHNQKFFLKEETPVDVKLVTSVLDEINSKNEKLKNFFCRDLRATVQLGKKSAKINGFLSYEKPKNFRLELKSVLGSELDVGSNQNHFWFWSKRMDDPGLYWSKHEDFNKTRLKTPFNPHWLYGCLGLETIDYQKIAVDADGSRWRIISKTKDSYDRPISQITYVDPKTKRITGHGIYNVKGQLEASSEIVTFKEDLPAKITFIWYQENASMIWYLQDNYININLTKTIWEMPNITPKIDMSRE